MTARTGPRHSGDEQQHVTVLAEGPDTLDPDGAPLATRLRIPAERTEPGPVGARVEVVLRSPDGEPLPLDLTGRSAWALRDRKPPRAPEDLRTDAPFLAQHVYAVTMDTLAGFERTLGRRVGWVGGRRLRIHANADIAPAETGYQSQDCAIYFGSTTHGMPIALYRDLLVHEVTHAVLDGYRSRWSDRWATLDQFALHEALADLVAMLSVFSSREVVERLIDARLNATGITGPVSLDDLDEAVLRSGLFGFADHLLQHDGAVRQPLKQAPPSDWRESLEPHWRASGTVKAIMEAVLQLWRQRLDAPGGRSSVYLVAAAGADVGTHLRRMLVRGLAYMPPVDVGPEDLLRGILAADEVLVPDDPRGYRDTLIRCFADVGVDAGPDDDRDGTAGLGRLDYGFGNAMLDAGPEEIIRFVWNNPALMSALCIDPQRAISVERVRTSTRISPEGFAVTETGASLVQEFVADRQEARGLGLRTAAPVVVRGGALLRFDGGGRLVYAAAKPVLDIERQQRKLDELRRERRAESRDPDSTQYRDAMVTAHARRWAE